MMNFVKFAAAAVLTTALVASSAAYASDQTALLANATNTAEHMKSDPAFGPARNMFNQARAVLIIPALVKGGFIFGAEGGDGVLVARNGKHWSSPAFYSMASASFGLQIGLEKAEIVLLIMSDRALKGIEQGDVKLGAGGGLTVVNLSGGAEAATPANLAGDIVVWTSASGAYGGLTLNGSVLKAMDDWNTSFYGKPSSVPDILKSKSKNSAASGLQRELASLH
jgi:lipid-binding SYLF domain-containing protein